MSQLPQTLLNNSSPSIQLFKSHQGYLRGLKLNRRGARLTTTLMVVCSLASFFSPWPNQAEARKKKNTIADEMAESLEDSFTKTPVDQEVCFSPDEPCAAKLLKFVDSAQKTLEIAIYDINLGGLVNHIIQKSKQIPVRMVVDRNQAKTPHSAVPILLRAGIHLKYGKKFGSGIMHNKFVIVDGKMIETGSFNQTQHAAHYNHENQIYLAAPVILDRYKKRFEILWDQAKEPTN